MLTNGFFKELLTFTGGVGKWGDELIVFASMNARECFREVIILIGVLGLSVTIQMLSKFSRSTKK